MEGQKDKRRRTTRQASLDGGGSTVTALTISSRNKLSTAKNKSKGRIGKSDKTDKLPKTKPSHSKSSAIQTNLVLAEYDPPIKNQQVSSSYSNISDLYESAVGNGAVSTATANPWDSAGLQRAKPDFQTSEKKRIVAQRSFPAECLYSTPLKRDSIHSRTCSACSRSDKMSNLHGNSVHGRSTHLNPTNALLNTQPKISDVKTKFPRDCMSPTLARSAENCDVLNVEEDFSADEGVRQIESCVDESDGNVLNSGILERQISPTDLAANNSFNNLNLSTSGSHGKPEDKFAIADSSSFTHRRILPEHESMEQLEGKLIVRSSDSEADSQVINRGEAIRLSFPLSSGAFKVLNHATLACQSSDNNRNFRDQSVQCSLADRSGGFRDQFVQCDSPVVEPEQSCKCGFLQGLRNIDAELAATLSEDTLKELSFGFRRYSPAPVEDPALLPLDCLPEDEVSVDSDVTISRVFQHVRMENARLQQLIFELERARSGTVKALLHVNGLLSKVQEDNARLEGDMKVLAQEKVFLLENLQTMKEEADSEQDKLFENAEALADNASRSGDNLRLVVDSWKKEKKDLMQALAMSTGASETAQKEAERLRGQYKKVKEQLEHANSAFTETLKNNLAATKRVEEELRASMEDKRQMLLQCDQAKKIKRDLESQRQEMQELQKSYEELQDEKDELKRRCSHLEKQKEGLVREADDLHEQIEHSQEIIEKLTEVEDELRQAVGRERSEKEYLQECLDETGQILYQLKHQEKSLVQEKDNLLDDLEAELEEKESLQTTLSKTMDEHHEIMSRLETMTNIHITVRESLQQANKKEKTYQEQIEVLTKTSHILHYALEKEKEEHYDLQELHHVMDMEHKKFRTETLSTLRDVQGKLEEATVVNASLKEEKAALERKSSDLQTSLEAEKEDCSSLRKQIARLEKLRDSLEKEVEGLTTAGEVIGNDMYLLKKKLIEVQTDLKTEKENHEKTSCSLEEAKEFVNRAQRDLGETRQKLSETSREYSDLQAQLKERLKHARELESNHVEACCQRDRFSDRLTYFENETKLLRKKLSEQGEEVYSGQVNLSRMTRERDSLKRSCESLAKDFEDHKQKCTENLKKLKDELGQLQQQILEKDKLALKAREHYQDQLGNTHEDLRLLRQMLDADGRQSTASKLSPSDLADRRDVNSLKMVHEKYRGEFSQHVDRLQEMLKISRQQSDSVTVVQSPMSKIKLEEIKQLRDEMLGMAADLASVRAKVSAVVAELTSAKLTRRSRRSSVTSESDLSSDQLERAGKFEGELASLDKVILLIEQRHHAVMNKNAKLLRRTLDEDEQTSLSLVHKFEIITLENESKQLKMLINLLKKKYEFSEHDLAEELKIVNGASEVSLALNTWASDYSHSNGNAYNSDASDSAFASSRTLSTRFPGSSSTMLSRTSSESNLRYLSGRASTGYTPLAHLKPKGSSISGDFERPIRSIGDIPGAGHRSSGFSSNCSSEDYEDEDDDFQPRRLKRHGTLPSRTRRPRPT